MHIAYTIDRGGTPAQAYGWTVVAARSLRSPIEGDVIDGVVRVGQEDGGVVNSIKEDREIKKAR